VRVAGGRRCDADADGCLGVDLGHDGVPLPMVSGRQVPLPPGGVCLSCSFAIT
jgi:hypothetical protein